MAYALERSEISLDEISQISFQQRAACAGKMLDEALLMLSAAKTAKEYEVALGHAGYFYILNFSAPDVGGELRKLTEALPQEVKSESSWETGMILRLENYLEHTIGCVYPSELTLAGAAQCANRAASQISENPEAALFAHYYALRAKRLGWTDIAVAEAAASNNLTEECLSAVAALEEEHTNGASDYRTYNFLRSPFDLTYQPACSYLRLPESD